MKIVTTSEIANAEVIETYGYVKGSSVRAKNIGRDIVAVFKNIIGGEINEYRQMMDDSRKMAISRMVEEAEAKGANAIISMRMVSSTIAQGVSEITVYGTAVKIKEVGTKQY